MILPARRNRIPDLQSNRQNRNSPHRATFKELKGV